MQASDIPGVPMEEIEHHLVVCPHARPVKQKVGKQALEWQDFIIKETRKLEEAGLGSAPLNVVGQSGGGAQGEWEMEAVR